MGENVDQVVQGPAKKQKRARSQKPPSPDLQAQVEFSLASDSSNESDTDNPLEDVQFIDYKLACTQRPETDQPKPSDMLLLIGEEGDTAPFFIAKFLKPKGSPGSPLLFQYWNNKRQDMKDAYHPVWIDTHQQEQYHQQQKAGEVAFTEFYNFEWVIDWGFQLTAASKLPATVVRKLQQLLSP